MKKLLTALVCGIAAITAQAQAWPTAKPVNLMVPFPPGGSTDRIARTLSTKLQELLGGTFIVQNTSGAGGTVGAATAKRAAPDGYNIFVSSLGPFVIGPHLVKAVAYDALKDFDYITVAVYYLVDEVINQYEIPTQSCILTHVTNQIQLIERGAPA